MGLNLGQNIANIICWYLFIHWFIGSLEKRRRCIF